MKTLIELKAKLHAFLNRLSFFHKGSFAKNNGLRIWYETFGNRNDPVILLIMGGTCQGIMWPEAFCNKLAAKGFFVIRFDHRDTGQSTSSKSPMYNLMDMARDTMSILDKLNISSAHLFGASMGGAIAQLIAGNFPSRVKSLILFASSSDYGVSIDALEGKLSNQSDLSIPSESYLNWIRSLKEKTGNRDQLELHLEGWRNLNGTVLPFEESLYRNIIKTFLKRQHNSKYIYHHIFALKASLNQLREVHPLIKAPTLIIHGEQDPLFHPDHAKSLAKAIKGSELFMIKEMGHNLHSRYYDEIIDKVITHISKYDRLDA